MGGSSYDRDVGHSSSSGRFSSGGTSSSGAKSALGRSGADPSTSPLNKIVKSDSEHPIVIALDVTGSNIEFARIVYDKAPMLHGQIEQQGYLKKVEICFSAIGDAYCDEAPLQVCDFAHGIKLDSELKKIWLEEGGGSGITESYELAAHYFANNCKMPKAKCPFMFFIADEKPYDTIEGVILKEFLGSSKQDYASKDAFTKLFTKFKGNVFLLQNPYGGTSNPRIDITEEVKADWKECFGPVYAQNIIPIHEEKSVVDVILGIIAMVSRTRNLGSYSTDLVKRGQTDTRIAHVKSSLEGLETALVPYVKIDLPAKKGGKKSGSGGRKL